MTNYSNEQAFGSGQSHNALTPSQRLAAIEHSQIVRRRRTKATMKVFGIVLLVFVSCVLVTSGLGEFLIGALLLGAVLSIAAIWSGAFDKSNRTLASHSEAEIDPRFLKELDQRLANLETIVGYEEKVAARNRQLENPQD